ncbi:hypothetical protein GUJ93_ZPchr0013g37122 [Zizania palustris]|uniref:Uncharacterized protein n=1 Tax=Zizania palustris TaxID=103762 RepID=A0A8J5WQX2_ZIZPA|nr:hypothetical protein GUJ93_ZPchr0013g37122 [Zizania palustris]
MEVGCLWRGLPYQCRVWGRCRSLWTGAERGSWSGSGVGMRTGFGVIDMSCVGVQKGLSERCRWQDAEGVGSLSHPADGYEGARVVVQVSTMRMVWVGGLLRSGVEEAGCLRRGFV